MNDMIDEAVENEKLQKEHMNAIARAKNKTIAGRGYCLSCNEPIKIGGFCGAECREGYEQERKMKRIAGK